MDLMVSIDQYEEKHRYKYLALYHALRDLILKGFLERGYRLPPSRELAKRYEMSRGTVNQVYEMLMADGYIETVKGSGTFVSFHHPKQNLDEVDHARRELHISPSTQKISLTDSIDISKHTVIYNLTTGIPSYEHFPFEHWKKAVKQAVDTLNYLVFTEEPPPEGMYSLRRAIAVYLNRSRGMAVHPDHIVIVNGSIHAIAILAQFLIKPGDKILVENPSYQRTRNVIQSSGGIPIPIHMNTDELVFEDWESHLAYVTPGHQYPTGRVMKLEERLRLLEWASKQNAIIIEDDIDSEFRRKGRPIEPLKTLDYDNRVIYLGTFYSTLLPALRIGYAVLPVDLKTWFLQSKHLAEPFSTSPMEQMAIAEFMKSGQYEKHVRRMRNVYARKYQVFRNLLDEYLPNAFRWLETDAGLHLFGWWQHSRERFDVFQTFCNRHGVCWEDPSIYFIGQSDPACIFSFSHLSEQEMHEAVRIMANALHYSTL